MPTDSLSSQLLSKENLEPLAEACATLIEEHVRQRGGIKGIAFRTGLSVLKASKPDILHRGIRSLLPEFATALEPLYAQFRESGERDFSAFLQARRPAASEALLHIADARVERSQNSVVRATYSRLRGGAEKDVNDLIPGLGHLIAQHLQPRA